MEDSVKKNKLYILISIVTLICLLGTAALCNQAGAEEDEAPTLKLEISDGPIFSEKDSTCSYEIEAIITGNPQPDIEFNQDDNVSLLTTEKVKVVLNDSSDTYTLEATATNTEGSSTASMNLSWGCEEEVSEEVNEESEEKATEDGEETGKEGEDSEEEMQEGEVLEGDPEPPELSIYIHEGPLYSAADDVCYYRIASEMYGNPYPKLTWSKDDSDGAFGGGMVQVNLKRGETYTLTATATSSEGTVNRTLDLSWGCDGDGNGENINQDNGDGEPQEIEHELAVPIVGSESGTIFAETGVSAGPIATAGDNYLNKPTMGFISFDISMLSDINIDEAILNLDGWYNGDVSFYNKFWINSIYWGPNPIDTVNRMILTGGGTVIEGYPTTSGNWDIICYNEILLNEIQKAIDENKPRFQIRIHFSGPITDNDGSPDNWIYNLDNSSLKIKYTS